MKKLNFKKIYCCISILFLGSCILFYGFRFAKLYIAHLKEKNIEKNSVVKVLKENNENNDYFVEINDQFYFVGNADNNYLRYSNILWRIIKINPDNSLTAIADNSLTSLAYGENVEYLDSNINKWLNKSEKEYSGILETQLNLPGEFLQKTNTCLDKVDTVSNNLCKDSNGSNYFSLLSTIDFANIGKVSYLINNENFYLNNTNTKKEVWYITDDGKLTISKGNDIIGVRPVITIKANIDYVGGDGSKNNPYTIEKDKSLFGSYVKLGDDIWRVYGIKDDKVKLMLNDYLKVDGNNITHSYSNNNYYHDDTVYGSLANYLNTTYYNSLPYKDLIKEEYFSNGYYNGTNGFDYESSLKPEVNTKVATLSVGDIFLNPTLENYFTMTSTKENGTIMHTTQANKMLYGKSVQTKLNIVPTIILDKNLLKKGNGTIESPLETE